MISLTTCTAYLLFDDEEPPEEVSTTALPSTLTDAAGDHPAVAIAIVDIDEDGTADVDPLLSLPLDCAEALARELLALVDRARRGGRRVEVEA